MRKVVGLSIAMSAFWLAFGQATWAQEKPVKRALLVNATRCKNFKDIEPLGDSADEQVDLVYMKKAMKAKGFTVMSLEDEKASLQGIKDALKELAAASKPGDVIVFYFSGHGAYGKDQVSLCPWDTNPANASSDLTETDLKIWLDTLKTRNVTLILDSCYSELAAGPPRAARARYRTKSITRKYAEPVSMNQKFHISQDQAVILSAANENGTALQIEPVHNAWAGLFTMTVAEELGRSTDTTTYRQFMTDVRRRVQNWATTFKEEKLGGNKIMQSPTVYGSDALLDRPLFAPVPAGGNIQPVAPPVAKSVGAVEKVENGNISLNVGSDSNITPGSRLDIVGKDGKHYGVTVTDVKPDTAVAVPDKDTNLSGITPRSAAIPTHAQINIAPAKNITVYLDGTPDFQAKMRQALSLYPFLKIVTEPDSAAQMIIKGEITADGIQGKMLEADGVTAVDPNNRIFTGKNADELVEQFSTELNQLVTVSAMLRMQNPAKPFSVMVASSKPQYMVGETATFTCKANQDCYIFLYAVDAAGYPCLLYPLKETESNFVKKEQTLELPPPASTLTYTLAPPYGYMKVAALAILDQKTAEALKKRLLAPQAPDAGNHKGARGGIRVLEDLQKLQLGPLEGWMNDELSISVLDPNEVAKAGKL